MLYQMKIRIIGAPLDLGSDHRGVDMGPSVLRAVGLNKRLAELGHEIVDAGNIPIKLPQQMAHFGNERAKYLNEVREACALLAREAEQALAEGEAPLSIGGDHSIAIGSIAGVAAHFRKRSQKIGLLWFDAHADINTPETTISGNIHGMPLAVALGMGDDTLTSLGGFAPKVDRKNVALIGIRDLDPLEKDLVKRSGIHVYTMRDIDERRMKTVMEEALAVATDGTAGFHVSFDMDFVEPKLAQAVATPVWGGATYRESHLAMEMVADAGKMVAFDLTEVNPLLDRASATAALGVELILSAFGKKIL